MPPATQLSVEVLDQTRDVFRSIVRESRSLPGLKYCDVRAEVVELKAAMVQNGQPKMTSEEHRLGIGIRVIAGDSVAAPGYYGVRLGSVQGLARALRDGLKAAHARALSSASRKAEARRAYASLGQSLDGVRLAPVPVMENRVLPSMVRDPRSVSLAEMFQYLVPVSQQVAGLDRSIVFNYAAIHGQLRRHLFCSSEGACIDQSYAMTEGGIMVVAQGQDGAAPLEIGDTSAHQCGWEVIENGIHSDTMQLPDFASFCLGVARTALEVASAPPVKPPDGEVVVVTDPHFNALVVHEVVGHPSELDRALKMETAYAGRSWLLTDLDETQVGKIVASPQLSAFSDPTLAGYGHYLYDDEGTPARRAVHIDKGVYREFMNSRQTAAVAGVPPNGSYKATEADFVPLIRMSNTVFGPGDRDPRDIVKEVERGFYVQGHRIPSVAESRENFCISAVKVYEISHGELGRLYRDGAVLADSRDYFMHVDAVGTDFRMFPIPNCGKGQPMQAKRMSNGGPTMRSVARIVGTQKT